MLRQFLQLLLIHFKEFLREPAIIFWGIVFPLLMAYGLGISFTHKGEIKYNIGIINDNNTTLHNFLNNRALLNSEISEKNRSFTAEDSVLGNVSFLFSKITNNEALILLKRGKISMYINSDSSKIHYHFDPLSPEAKYIYYYLSNTIEGKQLMPHSAKIVSASSSGMRYVDFLIPGLIAMNVMMSFMWGISYSMIEKRSNKLMRRMIATPMHKSFYLMAAFISRWVLTMVEATVLFIFTYFLFDINIQGSIFTALLIFTSGSFAFAGIAIFVSSRSSKTEVGNGLINLVVTPMMILSGIFFNYNNFPEWAIKVIEMLPLTIFANSLRSVFNEGVAFLEVFGSFSILAIIGVVFFAAGLKMFKWY